MEQDGRDASSEAKFEKFEEIFNFDWKERVPHIEIKSNRDVQESKKEIEELKNWAKGGLGSLIVLVIVVLIYKFGRKEWTRRRRGHIDIPLSDIAKFGDSESDLEGKIKIKGEQPQTSSSKI